MASVELGVQKGWNPMHLEKLRAAGLELRMVRTGGGYREKPYTAAELLGVAASLGDELRRLREATAAEKAELQLIEAEGEGRADEMRRLSIERDKMIEQHQADAAALAELRAELDRARALEPALAKMIVEQEAMEFAKAEAEAQLAALRGEGTRGNERIGLLEQQVQAEKEHVKLLERRLEAQREATIRLVQVLPPPPIFSEPDVGDAPTAPTIHLLTGEMRGPARTPSVSVQLDVGDEPPGTLTYLAESTTRAKAWVTYAEGCYKYALNTVLRMQDEADEAAKIKLENVEMLNEIRALRNAAAEAEAEAQKKAYVPPEEPFSPSKAKPPAPASDAVIPSPKRERRLGTNMEEEKHRALAEEATRRYEALLAELTDERQARASDGRRAQAELVELRKECAALRRVTEAALEAEKRGLQGMHGYVANQQQRRSRSPAPKPSPPPPVTPPSPADLSRIDSGSPLGSPRARPPPSASTRASGSSQFEMRRDQRRRAYEAQKVRAAQVLGVGA